MRTKAHSLQQAAIQETRVLKLWRKTTQTLFAMAAYIWPILTSSTALPSMLLSTSMTGEHPLFLQPSMLVNHFSITCDADIWAKTLGAEQLLATPAGTPTETARVIS